MLPSWVGDTIMATPALALLRHRLPKSIIMGLGRPGAAALLAGLDDLLDEVIEADGRSTLGPAKVAGRLRLMRIDACCLLPNSFSSAMTVRLAGIEVRVGYDRDGRGVLLTHKLQPARRLHGSRAGEWAPVSAVDYYLGAAHELARALAEMTDGAHGRSPEPDPPVRLRLATTRADEHLADDLLAKGGVRADEPFALLNPGGNNPAKRWPVERFAALAHHLISTRRMKVALNGSPGEAPLVDLIEQAVGLNHPEDASMVVPLPRLGGTIGSLKALTRRATVMVTNDTGPRHIAAAFGTPCVTLFGPTDPRWTTLPTDKLASGRPRERVLVADPTLPAEEVADDHPERCRIDRIAVGEVIEAVEDVLRG